MLAKLLSVLLLCGRVFAGPVPAVPVLKSCAPGCTNHGNCDGESGRCECQFGFGGADCSQRLMPACHNAPDLNTSIPAFGHFFPKNCFCHKQLAVVGCPRPFFREPQNCYYFQFWTWRDTYCYVLKDTPEERQFSTPPDGPNDPRFQWRKGLYDQAKADADPVQDPYQFVDTEPPSPYENLDRAVQLPAEKCPGRCSGRGWCALPPPEEGRPPKTPTCQCLGFYSGEACDKPTNEHCYLGCSGRGTCLGGYCHCKPGFWGLGCTRTKAFTAETWLPHPTKLRVYVYELPEAVSFRKPWHDVPALLDTMYLAEVSFMDTLLSDWSVRTENPWEANLFVINTYTIYYTGNIGFPARHFSTVFNHVRTRWPFWNMTGGRNHVAIATNDRGVCDLYKVAKQLPELQHPIKLVHFAQAGRHSRLGQPGQPVHGHEDSAFEAASREFSRLVVPEGGDANDRLRFRGFPAYSLESIRMEREPCFRPEQDVAIPNYLERGWINHLLEAYEYDNGTLGTARHKRHERPNLLYFNGFTKPDMAYSGGVRQGFLAMFGNTTRADVSINKGGGAKQLLESRFCLCPLGYGWGIRVTQALHTGCVPVLVQDHVYPAFWDVVPYEQFSVRINRHNLHRLFDLLEAITPEQLGDLQQGLAKWHKHFVWHTDVGGLAYNSTIASLHRRLLHMWTALFRSAS